jgi:ankyrin repeat protein
MKTSSPVNISRIRDDNKWTGLQWAVVNNHPEIVKILYQKQLEMEKKNAEIQKKLKN